MKLSAEDQQLRDELCRQNSVSRAKVLKLLQMVHDYEFGSCEPENFPARVDKIYGRAHAAQGACSTARESRNLARYVTQGRIRD